MDFVERYIIECARSFHHFCNVTRKLMELDVTEDYAKNYLSDDFNGKLLGLLNEEELRKYYENRNEVAILMLHSIDEVKKLH